MEIQEPNARQQLVGQQQPLLAQTGCRIAIAAVVIVGAIGAVVAFSAGGAPASSVVTVTTTTTAGSTVTTTTTTTKYVMKGVAYGPTPLKEEGGRVPNDDFWCARTHQMWGPKEEGNRGDLQIIKSLGANVVRLYGNDPRYNHKPFLEEARRLGLQVIFGMSDYPYTQMTGNCQKNGCDCYEVIKEQASVMLKSGILLPDKSYDSALDNIILINEPELKMVGTLPGGGECYIKAVISAFDGFLSAERAAGVAGSDGVSDAYMPSFTATFSYAVKGHPKPAIGQMLALQAAMDNAEADGLYFPVNDLKSAYEKRFWNSFNTQNPASDIQPQFLKAYQEHFQQKPVYIGEFHQQFSKVSTEMQEIVALAKDDSNPLLGMSFFEFQIRYDKGGTEMNFGMFGLGDTEITQVPLGDEWTNYKVWCLKNGPLKNSRDEAMSDGLAQAYGGTWLSESEKYLC